MSPWHPETESISHTPKRKDVSLEEMMLAMDAVDTIRHEHMLIDNELSHDKMRQALVHKLRDYYASQGVEVSDEMLESAVEEMGRNRYVHEPLRPGIVRMLASLYVHRWRHFRNTAIALLLIQVVLGVGGFAYNRLFVMPAQKEAAELEEMLGTTLPMQVEEAYGHAVDAAERLEDKKARLEADRIKTNVYSLIDNKDVDAAWQSLYSLEHLRDTLTDRQRFKDQLDEAYALVESVDTNGWDSDARKAIDVAQANLISAASSGPRIGYLHAREALDSLIKFINTPLDLRIVDRTGTLSGVWRTNDGGKTRVYYLVVEALDPTGNAVSTEIYNSETGHREVVDHWAVRVDKSEYDRVGRQKETYGVITHKDAGHKPAGAFKINWTLENTGDYITRW